MIYLLFVMGVTLLFYGPIKRMVIIEKHETVLREYQRVGEQPNSTNLSISQPSLSNVLKSRGESTYMGLIAIDRLGLNEYISPDMTDQSLFTGTVNLFPNRNPQRDNIVIVGHHIGEQSLLFGKLTEAKLKDTVRLIVDSYEYEYQVTKKYITTEENVGVMDNHQGAATLTLITCDQPTYTQNRLIIEAELVMDKPSTELQKMQEQERTSSHITTKRLINYLPLGILISLYVVFYLLIFKMRVKENG